MLSNHDYEKPLAYYLKSIVIIHLALTTGQILFAVVSVLTTKKIIVNVRFMDDPLVYIVPVFAAVGFTAANILYRKKVGNIDKTKSIEGKLKDYQTAFIIRCAALEVPSFFAIVAFLITGIVFFLLVSVLTIVYFFYIKPTREKISEALGLNHYEKQLFGQRDTVLR